MRYVREQASAIGLLTVTAFSPPLSSLCCITKAGRFIHCGVMRLLLYDIIKDLHT